MVTPSHQHLLKLFYGKLSLSGHDLTNRHAVPLNPIRGEDRTTPVDFPIALNLDRINWMVFDLIYTYIQLSIWMPIYFRRDAMLSWARKTVEGGVWVYYSSSSRWVVETAKSRSPPSNQQQCDQANESVLNAYYATRSNFCDIVDVVVCSFGIQSRLLHLVA